MRSVGWVEGRDAELVGDVVEDVVAVKDYVGLMDREDRAGCELGVRRHKPMREHRDKSRNMGKMLSGFMFPIVFPIGPSTPRGWPKAVVVHVEDDAIDRPVEASSQLVVGVVPPVRPRLANRDCRLEELAVLGAKGEAEPVLDPRHLRIRKAPVDRTPPAARRWIEWAMRSGTGAIMPHETHSSAARRAMT